MDPKDTNLENETEELEEGGEEIQSGLKIRTNLKAGVSYDAVALGGVRPSSGSLSKQDTGQLIAFQPIMKVYY